MTKVPTQRDLQAETRRAQLLDIALILFAERGVENVSIKDIAVATNVAPGLIYHYFRSKDELLEAVFLRHTPLADFEAIIRDIADLPAREGLLMFANRAALLLPEKRRVIRLLVRELLSPRSKVLVHIMALRESVMALLTQYLERQIAAGELRGHQPLVPIHMLVSSLLILLLIDQPHEPYVASLVDIILNGITAHQ